MENKNTLLEFKTQRTLLGTHSGGQVLAWVGEATGLNPQLQ